MGTFRYDGESHFWSTFYFENPGMWLYNSPYEPAYEQDLVLTEAYFGESTDCGAYTSLPAWYSDCSTAGFDDADGYVSYAFGSYHADQIWPGWYSGEWVMAGGPRDPLLGESFNRNRVRIGVT